MIVYLIVALLMCAVWAWAGRWYRKEHPLNCPSWPSVWCIAIIAGMFWPLALAWIVLHTVLVKFG